MWQCSPSARALSLESASARTVSTVDWGSVSPSRSTSTRMARLAFAPIWKNRSAISLESSALVIVRVAIVCTDPFRVLVFLTPIIRTRTITAQTVERNHVSDLGPGPGWDIRGEPARLRDRSRSIRDTAARGRRNRWLHAFGGDRDLLSHLDDVVVGVVDLQLALGAVAVLEHPLDPRQRVAATELAPDRLQFAQPPLDQCARGHLHALAGGEVHQRRVEPVAGGEPLVL